MLLTCSYRGQEFVRVGYFINNEYTDPELREMPPAKPQFDKVTRNILASKPRVTRFKINWDNAEEQNGEVAGPSEENNAIESVNGMEWNEEFNVNDSSQEHNNMMLAGGAGNENSNSLAMEC